jgi:hypothetical protein
VKFNQTAQTIIEMQNRDRAIPDMIFVKNWTSRWTVVNLDFISPDMATIRPMIVLSPMANTTPVHDPWTTKVELMALLRVSSALGYVERTVPGDHVTVVESKKSVGCEAEHFETVTYHSPVRRERSNRRPVEA